MEKQWRTWMQYIHMQIILSSQLMMILLPLIEVSASEHSYMSLCYTSI